MTTGGEVVAPLRDPSSACAFPARESASPSSGLVTAPVGPAPHVGEQQVDLFLHVAVVTGDEVSPTQVGPPTVPLAFRDLGFRDVLPLTRADLGLGLGSFLIAAPRRPF
jgi:hypothetical protein